MPVTRLGIIGCGGAAVSAAEAIAATPSATLVMVHDVAEAPAASFGQRFEVPFTTHLDTLLADRCIDAVYIAVPHNHLAPLAHQALTAGKHVLVEKPMALTLEDADALIGLADRRALTLGVFYEYRLAAPFAQAREIVQAGAVGEITGVRLQTLIDKPLRYWASGYTGVSVSPWRAQKTKAGGGVVLMNTSHQLDALRYITGLEVTSVSAQAATLTAPVEVEDIAAATLRFSNGAVGSLLAGAHIPGECAGERFDIYGTNGQLRVPDPYTDDVEDPVRVYLAAPWGDLAGGAWHSLPRTVTPVFAEMIGGFALAVQRGAAPPVSGRDGRHVLEVILAIYRAAAEGQTIVLEHLEVNHASP
jgi:UDP-N-acetyl-2-amino-2-deoxyglucuronate dehydrogenase